MQNDAAQAALDEFKKAREDNNLTKWKQNLKHWTKKLKTLQQLYECFAAARNAPSRTEGAQATGNGQAMTS